MQERATDVTHSGLDPREPPNMPQAGLRAHEWRNSPRDDTFPSIQPVVYAVL